MSQNMSLESIEKYVNNAKVTEVTKNNIFELSRLAALSRMPFPQKRREQKIIIEYIPAIADAIYSLNLIPGLKDLLPELDKDFKELSAKLSDISKIIAYLTKKENYHKVDNIKDFFNNPCNFTSTVSYYSQWDSNTIKRLIDSETEIMTLQEVFDVGNSIVGINFNFVSISENSMRKFNFKENDKIKFFNHGSRYLMFTSKDDKNNHIISSTFINKLNTLETNKFEFELYLGNVLISEIIGLYHPLKTRTSNITTGQINTNLNISNNIPLYSNTHINDNLYKVLALFGIIEKELNNISSREYIELLTDFFTDVISMNCCYDYDEESVFSGSDSFDEIILTSTEFTVKIIKEVLERFYGINQ